MSAEAVTVTEVRVLEEVADAMWQDEDFHQVILEEPEVWGVEALNADRRRTIGLARVDERWFTFCAGLGLDAEVVRRVEHRRADGRREGAGRDRPGRDDRRRQASRDCRDGRRKRVRQLDWRAPADEALRPCHA